jgi:hypothetical protein
MGQDQIAYPLRHDELVDSGIVDSHGYDSGPELARRRRSLFTLRNVHFME